MCGEKIKHQPTKNVGAGSPPHVRGKAFLLNFWLMHQRITPACAGKSSQIPIESIESRDHPRMCGEKILSFPPSCRRMGSPPHVRGKEFHVLQRLLPPGITPACAGKRLKRFRSTVSPVAIVPLFPSVCNKPVVSDGSPAGRDAPLFLPAENAVPASPAYNLRSL